MVKDLVIIGSGGIDIVRLIERINAEKPTFNLLGFLEQDEKKIGTNILGYPILGNDDLLLTKCSKCSVVNNVMHTPRIHEQVTRKLIDYYHVAEFPNIVSPSINRRGLNIGIGNILYNDNRLGTDVLLGDFNIMYAASVGHETIFGNYNLVANSVIGSRCQIGSYNLIGNSTTLANSLRMGDDNEVGVGSVVMKNVKDGHHLLGYPAIEMEEFVKKYLTRKTK